VNKAQTPGVLKGLMRCAVRDGVQASVPQPPFGRRII